MKELEEKRGGDGVRARVEGQGSRVKGGERNESYRKSTGISKENENSSGPLQVQEQERRILRTTPASKFTVLKGITTHIVCSAVRPHVRHHYSLVDSPEKTATTTTTKHVLVIKNVG